MFKKYLWATILGGGVIAAILIQVFPVLRIQIQEIYRDVQAPTATNLKDITISTTSSRAYRK